MFYCPIRCSDDAVGPSADLPTMVFGDYHTCSLEIFIPRITVSRRGSLEKGDSEDLRIRCHFVSKCQYKMIKTEIEEYNYYSLCLGNRLA